MKSLTPNKYRNSKLNGTPIKEVQVLSDDSVKVISTDGSEFDTWIEGSYEFDFTADYILCDLQHLPEIKVSKY